MRPVHGRGPPRPAARVSDAARYGQRIGNGERRGERMSRGRDAQRRRGGCAARGSCWACTRQILFALLRSPRDRSRVSCDSMRRVGESAPASSGRASPVEGAASASVSSGEALLTHHLVRSRARVSRRRAQSGRTFLAKVLRTRFVSKLCRHCLHSPLLSCSSQYALCVRDVHRRRTIKRCCGRPHHVDQGVVGGERRLARFVALVPHDQNCIGGRVEGVSRAT